MNPFIVRANMPLEGSQKAYKRNGKMLTFRLQPFIWVEWTRLFGEIHLTYKTRHTYRVHMLLPSKFTGKMMVERKSSFNLPCKGNFLKGLVVFHKSFSMESSIYWSISSIENPLRYKPSFNLFVKA